MRLNDALDQISQIRQQITQSETFRGYRSLAIGLTGLLGVLAAVVQAVQIPRPQEQFVAYLTLWAVTAVASLVLVGVDLAVHYSLTASPRTARLTRWAVEQFLPCLVAGALLTSVVSLNGDGLWMMPGLWALLFSLGVFASCRLLPAPIFWVGVYYLCSGTLCLAIGNGPAALSPWMMAATFGGGQLTAAVILYWTLERHRDEANAW